MEKTITFTVNGQSRTVTTDPARRLLDVLREDLQLTGPKCGCGEGRCGACNVLIDGKCTATCTTPVGDVEGSTIVTIEGLCGGEALHPVQAAFLDKAALQCGYCTPGMIMAAVGLLAERPRPTRDEILATMEGHICRCGNYARIVEAIQQAAGTGEVRS